MTKLCPLKFKADDSHKSTVTEKCTKTSKHTGDNNTSRFGTKSLTQNSEPCRICGRLVDQSVTEHSTRPREYHENCRELAKHLNAVAKHLPLIVFEPSSRGMECALLLKRTLFGLSNSLPRDRVYRRDEKGRFLPEDDSGEDGCRLKLVLWDKENEHAV